MGKVKPAPTPRTSARKRIDPLPESFASLEEAAEFWDTHDSGDYEEFMEPVDVEIEIKNSVYLLPLAHDVAIRIGYEAKKQGVTVETLANLLLQRALHEQFLNSLISKNLTSDECHQIVEATSRIQALAEASDDPDTLARKMFQDLVKSGKRRTGNKKDPRPVRSSQNRSKSPAPA